MKELLVYTIYVCLSGGYCYQPEEIYHNTREQCIYYSSQIYYPYADKYMCVDAYRKESYILSLPTQKIDSNNP